MSRELSDDSDAMELLQQELMLPIHQLMKSAIAIIKPEMSEEKISLCISSTTGQVFHFVRCPDMLRALAGRLDETDWLKEIRNHIINFSLNGLEQESK